MPSINPIRPSFVGRRQFLQPARIIFALSRNQSSQTSERLTGKRPDSNHVDDLDSDDVVASITLKYGGYNDNASDA